MNLMEAREGKTQTLVLAAVAEHELENGEPPQQSEVVERLPVSKGAVSNNTQKLVDDGLLAEDDGGYVVERAQLANAYREHYEEYLQREPQNPVFADEVEDLNELRTEVKGVVDGVFTSGVVESVVMRSLVGSLDRTGVQTLREVFLWTDHTFRTAADHLEVDVSDAVEDVDSGEASASKVLAIAAAPLRSYREACEVYRDLGLETMEEIN